MPKSKEEIHELLSPRIKIKHKIRDDIEKNKRRDAKYQPPGPPSVDNFSANSVLFGPHKIKKPKKKKVNQRKIGPNEGAPTVNSKTGRAVKALTHKPGAGKQKIDDTAGAIDKTKTPKRGAKNKNTRKRRSRKRKKAED